MRKIFVIVLLSVIFLAAFIIRIANNVPDRILSFDPVFEYRFTWYVANYGHMPIWDELSYYPGRFVNMDYSILMHYLTAAMYMILKSFGMSLLTVASYAGAIYGAMIIFPAFLLGREISNKYGGLVAAVLIGTAPQILIRTFGSSYDTDSLVLFFILLTTYLGVRALKVRTPANISLAILGFVAFMMVWGFFAFTFFIAVGFVIVSFFLMMLFDKDAKKFNFNVSKNLASSIGTTKQQIFVLIVILMGIIAIGLALGTNVLTNFASLVGFSQAPETWIVNISIAELQQFNIWNVDGWVTAMGRFITGYDILNTLLFISFLAAIAFGFYATFRKKDVLNMSFLITLLVIGIYTTTRGVRFTEYTSAFNLILISVGFGYLMEFFEKKDAILKTFSAGAVLSIVVLGLMIGQQVGTTLGPDQDPNWDSAWNFLKTQTPEDSLVGTWWDPGHMITGLAQRRVFADGAHCTWACKYNINERISDLGLIMATSDENVSLNLIRKYQGNSPEVYWIASNDLIGKYQWLQYFGTDCDARKENTPCPLYIQLSESNRYSDNNGNIVFNVYAMTETTSLLTYNSQPKIPIYVNGINAALFDEIIVNNGTQPITIKFTAEEKNSILASLQPLERQLNVRFTNQSIPMTVWMPNDPSYIVIIPPNLRNTVFTKMFILEGQGLDHFKQVFRNEAVKIYQVV